MGTPLLCGRILYMYIYIYIHVMGLLVLRKKN